MILFVNSPYEVFVLTNVDGFRLELELLECIFLVQKIKIFFLVRFLSKYAPEAQLWMKDDIVQKPMHQHF